MGSFISFPGIFLLPPLPYSQPAQAAAHCVPAVWPGRKVVIILDEKLFFRRRRFHSAGALVLMLLLGYLYAWSVFVTPLEAEFSWSRSETSLVYAISTVFNAASALLGAALARHVSRSLLVRASGFIVMAGFLSASFATQLWQLCLSYGVFLAGGLGIIYNLVVSSAAFWYPERPATISGLFLTIYGFSAVLLGIAATALIDRFGWRRTFRIFGVVFFAMIEILAYCACLPPPKMSSALRGKNAAVPSGQSATPAQMMRTLSFWVFVMWTIFMAATGMTLSSHAAPMAQAQKITGQGAAILAGLVSVGSGCGRLLFGALYDRMGRKTLLLVPLTGMLGSLCLYLSYVLSLPALLAAAFLIVGCGFGGSPVCSTGFIERTFGSLYYGVNLSLANLAVLLSAFAGPYLSGVLYQISGYSLVSLLILLYAFLSAALGLFLSGTQSRRIEADR